MQKTPEIHPIPECLKPFYREVCEEISRKAAWITDPEVQGETVRITVQRIPKHLKRLRAMPEKERSAYIAGAIKKNRVQVLRNQGTHNRRHPVCFVAPRTLEFLATVPDRSGSLEAEDALEKTLPRLTELERKVLTLALDEGWTRTAIAASLGTSVANVTQTLGRARRKFENFLK